MEVIQDKLSQAQRVRAEALAFALDLNHGKGKTAFSIVDDALQFEKFINRPS